MIQGEPVTVLTVSETGRDSFNAPISEEASQVVNNVLVAPAATSDLSSALRAEGDKTRLTLHFPKTFQASLRGAKVVVRGQIYRVVGDPQPYMIINTPGQWCMPVEVEKVDG